MRSPLVYAEAVLKYTLKFAKLNTAAQQREAVVQGRSLLPYRLRYIFRSDSLECGLRFVLRQRTGKLSSCFVH
ncbi:MAG: hypothetical protein LBK06_08215 [Planctomycetaceae bacterium]|nr:hypothetical protein [Planctomycetaceae bacterium]